MSAYSTLYANRAGAKNYINSAINLDEISNEDLERIMDILLDKQLYNCKICDNGNLDIEG